MHFLVLFSHPSISGWSWNI